MRVIELGNIQYHSVEIVENQSSVGTNSWNWFSLIESDLFQTNNSVEKWYNSFSSMLHS